MNLWVTDDNKVYEQDNREAYRQRLIASRQAASLACSQGNHRECYMAGCTCPCHGYRSLPYHYDFHGVPATWWEVAGLTLFAMAMLAVLAEALAWGLR